jgi:glyoxylase-like metal-dependent hydrolase (beta-lactamase superfamily II)
MAITSAARPRSPPLVDRPPQRCALLRGTAQPDLAIPIAAHPATARRLAGRVEVTHTIEDGETAYGATAIFTPGHAEGHLCYAVGDATIAGDMVAGLGTILIDPVEGDMAVYLASPPERRSREVQDEGESAKRSSACSRVRR